MKKVSETKAKQRAEKRKFSLSRHTSVYANIDCSTKGVDRAPIRKVSKIKTTDIKLIRETILNLAPFRLRQ